MSQETRQISLEWWNKMGLEQQFYKTIKHNDLIVGDKSRHPHSLSGREIEIIYNAEHNIENSFQKANTINNE